MIKLTDDQWLDITQIISSYRADLIASDEEFTHEIEFIDALITEILEDQDGMDIEFTMEEEDES